MEVQVGNLTITNHKPRNPKLYNPAFFDDKKGDITEVHSIFGDDFIFIHAGEKRKFKFNAINSKAYYEKYREKNNERSKIYRKKKKELLLLQNLSE